MWANPWWSSKSSLHSLTGFWRWFQNPLPSTALQQCEASTAAASHETWRGSILDLLLALPIHHSANPRTPSKARGSIIILFKSNCMSTGCTHSLHTRTERLKTIYVTISTNQVSKQAAVLGPNNWQKDHLLREGGGFRHLGDEGWY